MEFENITYAPIDLDGIDPEQMSPREKQMLNDYHKKVYEVLSPYMTEEENEWLKKYTAQFNLSQDGTAACGSPFTAFYEQ